MGGGDQALAVTRGVGEGAADVAEQLVLEQRLRDGGAVDHHERAFGARRQVVDGAGDQLLAGPALTEDGDGDVGRRHHRDALVQGLDPRPTADEDVALARPALRLAPGRTGAGGRGRPAVGDPPGPAGAIDPQAQLGPGQRLGDEVEGVEPERLDGDLRWLASRHEDDAGAVGLAAERLQHLLRALARQVVVEQHHVEAGTGAGRGQGRGQRAGGVAGADHAIPRAEQAPHDLGHRRLVVHHQDAGDRRGLRHGTGRAGYQSRSGSQPPPCLPRTCWRLS